MVFPPKNATQLYTSIGKAHKHLADGMVALHQTESNSQLSERIKMLGIPDAELTESVVLALSALIEKMDDTSLDLQHTKECLAEMESLVDVDLLAPIPNRRAFMRRLNWVISMFDRYGHPSCVIYFDLNSFKQINDTFGHAAGDGVIRHVAEILNKSRRDSDFMARLGGDEFAIIFYNSPKNAAIRRAEEIATMLADAPYHYHAHTIPVTTSFGCYALQAGNTAEDVIHAADQAMYCHKRSLKQTASGVSA